MANGSGLGTRIAAWASVLVAGMSMGNLTGVTEIPWPVVVGPVVLHELAGLIIVLGYGVAVGVAWVAEIGRK